uniref:Uncharacterized protein n=1 Tax=Fusarium oxysporum f. sp. physali TaxID=2212625 RepID=A0A7U0Q6I4_FUSOX|nr:hypothetical protein [Fusarium oxysporum f. sp. physali]
MKFLTLALTFVATAMALPSGEPDGHLQAKREPTPPGCARAYWNTKPGGGWSCDSALNGDCKKFVWKENPPYWSCN